MIRILAGLFTAAAAFALFSCATTPKPAATTTPQTTTAQTAVAAPDAELAQAKDLKAEIDKYGLAAAAPDVYQAGSDALTAGQQAYGTDNATAKSQLDIAVQNFQQVLDSGFPAKLKTQAQNVTDAKNAALANKADHAVPDEYKAATDLEDQAQQKASAGDNQGASDLYDQALAAFNKAAADAAAKKAAAQQALGSAGSQIDQSTATIQSLQNDLSNGNTQSAGTTPNGGGQ